MIRIGFILGSFLPLLLFAQSSKKDMSDAFELYQKGKYTDASKKLESSLDKSPNTIEGSFNLGDSYFREERYEEAAEKFQESVDLAVNPELKSKAYHNLGNSQLQSGKLKESIESYKQALRLNPQDNDARYNLAFAMKKLKEQEQQQQQQDQNKDQNKDQEDKKDQEEQQNQDKKQDKDQEGDQEKKEDQENQSKEQESKEGDNKEQEKKPQPQAGEEKENQISKEDAARILEALKNQEQETQDKLRKQKIKAKGLKIEKDW